MNTKKIYRIVLRCSLIALVAVSLFGCGRGRGVDQRGVMQGSVPANPPEGSSMLDANLHAGDVLARMLVNRMEAPGGILVTNLVDLDRLDQSNTFGRLATQQIGSRLGQQGFRVVESRLAENMSMSVKNGEFMLSRDTRDLMAQEHNAAAVLVGTYANADTRLFISVRVIGLARNTVIAAYEYFLPLNGDTENLFYAGGSEGGGAGAPNNGATVRIWQQYAKRQPAFGGHGRSEAKPQAESGQVSRARSGGAAEPARHAVRQTAPSQHVVTAGTAERQGAVPQSVPERGGRRIDPTAPPTPFPGGRR